MGKSNGHVDVGLAVEDNAHVVLVRTLAQRVATEDIHWLDAETLAVMCRWLGPVDDGEYKIPKGVEYKRAGRKFRIHGKIAGAPLLPEAGMYRRILVAFEQRETVPDVVIIARDGDGYAEQRRSGFQQVVEGVPWSFAVILTMPEPESEAWFVCGFEPNHGKERARLESLRDLNFNPIMEPHRLTSRPNDARTDAKRVAKVLFDDDQERRNACLERAPLATLVQRGQHAGLAQFIDDLRRVLVPLVDPSQRAPD